MAESIRFWVLACSRVNKLSYCSKYGTNCNCPNNDNFCYDYKPTQLTEETPETQKKPKLDILFIVDDSGSMGDSQTALRNNVDKFSKEFFKRAKEIDFRLFAFTTGDNRQLLQNPITSTNVDWSTQANIDSKSAALGNALKAGTRGSGRENPLASAVHVINNNNIVRPNAYLNIIFITDAGIQSGSAVQDFNKMLQNKNIPGKRVILQGALHQAPGQLTTTCDIDCQTTNQTKITPKADICSIDAQGQVELQHENQECEKCSTDPDTSIVTCIKCKKLCESGSTSCGSDNGDFEGFRSLIQTYTVGGEKNHFNVCARDYGRALARLAFNVINRIVRTYSPGK